MFCYAKNMEMSNLYRYSIGGFSKYVLCDTLLLYSLCCFWASSCMLCYAVGGQKWHEKGDLAARSVRSPFSVSLSSSRTRASRPNDTHMLPGTFQFVDTTKRAAKSAALVNLALKDKSFQSMVISVAPKKKRYLFWTVGL